MGLGGGEKRGNGHRGGRASGRSGDGCKIRDGGDNEHAAGSLGLILGAYMRVRRGEWVRRRRWRKAQTEGGG